MKIRHIEAIYPRWTRQPQAWQKHFWQIVVRVDSDLGISGLGYGGGGPPAVEVINRHLRHVIDGFPVDSIDDIGRAWDRMYRQSLPYGRRGIAMMALSGVDLALWDLLGKACRQPVYELLGGRRKNDIRAYATTYGRDRFAHCRDLGYTAVKFGAPRPEQTTDVDEAAETAAHLRALLGPAAMVMADYYMAWDVETAQRMAAALGPHGVDWIEDVATPDHLDELALLRGRIKPVRLAGGEHEFSHHDFRHIARAGALDLWQPDLTWCGGITEARRILALADEHDIPVVLHRGGEIWGLHFIAATGCPDLAETMPHRWDTPFDQLWLDEPVVHDGVIAPLDRPGFGVRLNESMLP